MLGDTGQPELEEVHLIFVALDSDKSLAIAPRGLASLPVAKSCAKQSLYTHCSVRLLVSSDSVTLALYVCSTLEVSLFCHWLMLRSHSGIAADRGRF